MTRTRRKIRKPTRIARMAPTTMSTATVAPPRVRRYSRAGEHASAKESVSDAAIGPSPVFALRLFGEVVRFRYRAGWARVGDFGSGRALLRLAMASSCGERP